MDLPGEKLVIKLWETLAEKGIGSLLTPWQVKREGRAHTEVRRAELLILAQAETDAADIRAGRKRLERDGSVRLLPTPAPESNARERGDGRIEPMLSIESLAEVSARVNAAQEARKEINVSRAIIHAEEVLAGDPQSPPDRAVEEDWLFTWRDYAGKVSTADLQQLWGKILAGEIKSPGSYSIRTMDFLKALSKQEAEEITKLAAFVIEGCIFRGLKQYLEENGVPFNMLRAMQELGVLSGVEAVGLSVSYGSWEQGRYVRVLCSNGKGLLVEHEDPAKKLKVEAYTLTSVGKQILGLGSFSPNVPYLRLAGKEITKQGFTVHLTDWVQMTEDMGRYFNPEKIEP